MITGIELNYNELRKVNPEAARLAVVKIYEQNQNKSETAKMFCTTRKTIRKCLAKYARGDLTDDSKAPHTMHNKTELHLENLVIEVKNKTNYGPERIHFELLDHYDTTLSKDTIKNILRRNRDKIKRKKNFVRREKVRDFVDWYHAKAFEVVQVDLKYVVDQKALSKEQIDHIHKYDLPLYQWSAVDVNSRFKLIAYSREKTWTNGLVWYLWITSWLRSHGVTSKILYTVDNGEEFGGRSWFKVKELNKLLSGFGCKVRQNHKGHCEENAHVERSHRTDDDEFYIPKIETIHNDQEFYDEAFQYIYYYNVVRRHSSLDYKRPWEYLKEQSPEIDDKMRLVKPIILDNFSARLTPWGGYHVLTQNQILSRHLFRSC